MNVVAYEPRLLPRWRPGSWSRKRLLRRAARLNNLGRMPTTEYAALLIQQVHRAHRHRLKEGESVDCLDVGILVMSWLGTGDTPAGVKDAEEIYGPFLRAPYELGNVFGFLKQNESLRWGDDKEQLARRARRRTIRVSQALDGVEAWLAEKNRLYPTIIKLLAFAIGGSILGPAFLWIAKIIGI